MSPAHCKAEVVGESGEFTQPRWLSKWILFLGILVAATPVSVPGIAWRMCRTLGVMLRGDLILACDHDVLITVPCRIRLVAAEPASEFNIAQCMHGMLPRGFSHFSPGYQVPEAGGTRLQCRASDEKQSLVCSYR